MYKDLNKPELIGVACNMRHATDCVDAVGGERRVCLDRIPGDARGRSEGDPREVQGHARQREPVCLLPGPACEVQSKLGRGAKIAAN